ncbi:AMP-binding protein [Piscinibacter aquaticus]|uniref:AMP-binding protein n=1 Tax=Piscinibacter aquaticus TaxID=392597 RepID=A0A5C6TZA6_9BURK|nr:AMP-binding protein [Piscinibacter aquaticus]
MLEHRAVVNFLCSMQREPGIGPGDRFVSVTTLSFDIAGLEIHGPLTCGGTVVLASRATALDGRALAALLEAERASLLQATPSTWRLLLDSGWTGRAALKMLCGGEALPRDLAERLIGRGGELWNMYGPTETTIWSTLWRVTEASGAIPIGRPIANTQCYVLDERNQPVPVGVGGELCIGGDGLARGYLGREDLTAQKFVDIMLPETGVRRVYRTGDVVRWRADGALEYVGRRDHQVKLRGYRIELGEIEAVLAAHEGVKDNVVQVREDAPGDQRLVAYVVAEPGQRPEPAAMRATLQLRLPEYMVPNLFVALEALPLTPNGKVDRKALPVPPRAAPADPGVPAQPMTPTQARVAALWGQVLQLARVGLDDDFFGLGGHSLLLVRLQAALQREFERELPLVAMFQGPTVRQMSELLAAGDTRRHAAQAIPRVPRDQPLPVSLMQERLWLFEQLEPDSSTYHIPAGWRLRGPIDLKALRGAVDARAAPRAAAHPFRVVRWRTATDRSRGRRARVGAHRTGGPKA